MRGIHDPVLVKLRSSYWLIFCGRASTRAGSHSSLARTLSWEAYGSGNSIRGTKIVNKSFVNKLSFPKLCHWNLLAFCVLCSRENCTSPPLLLPATRRLEGMRWGHILRRPRCNFLRPALVYCIPHLLKGIFSMPNMTGRAGCGTMEWIEEVPRRTSLVPLASPCLCFVLRVTTEGHLDYQGRARIMSIVWWNLRPAIFGVDFQGWWGWIVYKLWPPMCSQFSHATGSMQPVHWPWVIRFECSLDVMKIASEHALPSC